LKVSGLAIPRLLKFALLLRIGLCDFDYRLCDRCAIDAEIEVFLVRADAGLSVG